MTTRLATDCPACGGFLRVGRRRSDGGEFLGCSNYPRCKYVEPISAAVEQLAREAKAVAADLSTTENWIRMLGNHMCAHGDCAECMRLASQIERLL